LKPSITEEEIILRDFKFFGKLGNAVVIALSMKTRKFLVCVLVPIGQLSHRMYLHVDRNGSIEKRKMG
jgi:hypothetical protein